MWPLTIRQVASLAASTARTARVDILRDGQPVDGGTIDADHPTLRLVGGTVQVDRATVRRSGTVRIHDTSGTLLPDSADDLFAPLIGELRLWQGIRYADASPAETLAGTDWFWIPVGTLVVMSVDEADPFVYDVALLDRLQFLQSFPTNYAVAAGTPTAQALADLLSFFIPASHRQVNLPAQAEFVTGSLLYEAGSASADVAHDLALSMGLALYADPMGVVTAQAEPTTDDPAVWTIQAGPASAMMRVRRGVSASDAVNAVTYTGEASDLPPVMGYAEDTDPQSLTYRARVGYRPAPTQSSPLMLTSAQCQLAARTWLQRNLGLAGSTTVPLIPNPALESGDVLQLIDPAQALSVTVIADSFPVDLFVGDTQDVTCRPRVVR